MHDAVEATGKPVGVVRSRLIACIQVRCLRAQVEVDSPEGSPKVGFRMVLVLRIEELAKIAYMGVQPTHGTVHDSHS